MKIKFLIVFVILSVLVIFIIPGQILISGLFFLINTTAVIIALKIKKTTVLKIVIFIELSVLAMVIIPLPIFILDLLFLVNIMVIIIKLIIKKPDALLGMEKYIFFSSHFFSLVFISASRAIIVQGTEYSSVIAKLFANVKFQSFEYSRNFNLLLIMIYIIILLKIALNIYKCKQEQKMIVFENIVINRKNGVKLTIGDVIEREKIIGGYNNIISYNIITLIYCTINMFLAYIGIYILECINTPSLRISYDINGYHFIRLLELTNAIFIQICNFCNLFIIRIFIKKYEEECFEKNNEERAHVI